MDAPLRPLTFDRPSAPRASPGSDGWLRFAPGLTLAVFLGPIAVGLAGTVLPAFGLLPALGGDRPTLAPFRDLTASPGVGQALSLTLTTGIGATLLSLLLALLIAGAGHGRRPLVWARRALAPVVALPPAALAIGLAFLIAPSGWLARLLSPWLTGWELPPDLLLVNDRHGLALMLGLVVKETPFLLFAVVAGLAQCDADRAVATARSLGYGPLAAWFKAVLPRLYPQIRLPVYAVLVFGLSNVDMAVVLGPATPPSFAVLVVRWFNDPDLALRFQAAAGACLHLGVTASVIALWRAGEAVVARATRPALVDGRRGRSGPAVLPKAAVAMVGLVGLVALLGVVVLALWSMAGGWSFPHVLPEPLSLRTWSRSLDELAPTVLTTVLTAGAATALALALALACLEHEQRAGITPTTRVLWLLYLPLLLPQIGFLFGVQIVLVLLGLDGTWLALVWVHTLFVLPYVFLTLAASYRALDLRYAQVAFALGHSPARVFWRVKLPLLRRALGLAAAIGIAVSTAEYLPTLFAGGGRLTTLATEAVARAAGGDRRVAAVFALCQTLLPLVAFALAFFLSRRRFFR